MNAINPKYKIGQVVYYKNEYEKEPKIEKGIIYKITAEPAGFEKSMQPNFAKAFQEIKYGVYKDYQDSQTISTLYSNSIFEEDIYLTFNQCKRVMIYNEFRLIEKESEIVAKKIELIEELNEE